MSQSSLITDPNAGGDVEANLDFAADGLTVFGPGGRKFHHWPYGEIIHAFPKTERKDATLAHSTRPELRLQVRDAVVYDAIAARAPQLRRRGFGWTWLWKTLEGMPDDAKLGLLLLAGIVTFSAYRLVTGWLG